MAAINNYDSEFCGSIPIHHVNRIQDHGYMVVLDPADLAILQISENCVDILNPDVNACIGHSFAAYCAAEDVAKLKALMSKKAQDRMPVAFALRKAENSIQLQGLLHLKADYAILELECAGTKTERTFSAVFQEVKHITAALDQAHTVDEVAVIAVHELRRISGFDGVLMYCFDENWNGKVIAEEKDASMEPYLGQTFPASDIPKQARQLYLKNPYRLIPNREFTPVSLFPVLNPVTHSFIDLSDCNLRSVPGVHLEYMANMGIMASMSLRVIKDGRLWGLISCHHKTAHYLDQEICAVFEWLSTVISNRIAMVIDKLAADDTSKLHLQRTALVDQVYAKNDIAGGLFGDDGINILDLFEAGGAVIYLNGAVETLGNVPKANAIEDLHLWLQGKDMGKVYASSHFSAAYEDAAVFANVGSGILVVPINHEKGDYLVCLKPEVVETINWGGDPHQAIHFDADGKRYHPRNSFQLWKQEILHHSTPWKHEELEIAETLRHFLFEFRIKQLYI